MQTLIDALCQQLTILDARLCDAPGSASMEDANRKFRAIGALVEAYGYSVCYSFEAARFYAEFNIDRALRLGIPECEWPDHAIVEYAAREVAEVRS